MGPSCCPPASWCKRFNIDNAWLKPERFLTGSVLLPDLLREIHQFACSESILILTFDRYDLVLQERPIHDKSIHLDFFEHPLWQSWNSEVHVHLVQHCLLVT